MKQIKCIFSAALALCLMLSLCACGGSGDKETTAGGAATTAATTAPDQTDETAAPVDDGKVLYRVTVEDQDGNPISGVMVQICLEVCMPAVTNESGVAEFNTQEADYKVTLLTLPEGYAYTTEEQEFHFAAGSTELTITLKAEA